jgi:hypothetical protein
MSKLNIVMPSSCILIGVMIGIVFYHLFIISKKEGFTAVVIPPECLRCRRPSPCGCRKPKMPCSSSQVTCPPCREPNLSAYVLKTTIPPCPPQPDLSKYMLKTECPAVPDLSNYVLKSSVPKQQPVILDCTKCNKPSGECPPCPRPRCPTLQCPPLQKCPPPAPSPRQVCPPTVVKCKAQDAPIQQVRPYLAPLSVGGFGFG